MAVSLFSAFSGPSVAPRWPRMSPKTPSQTMDDPDAAAVGQDGPVAPELLQPPVQSRVDRDVERPGDLRRRCRPVLRGNEGSGGYDGAPDCGRSPLAESYSSVVSRVRQVQ
jgi:hypothetical protein